MSDNHLMVMAAIQEEKIKEISEGGLPPLNPEGIAMAEDKRSTFDLPINVAQLDPLR